MHKDYASLKKSLKKQANPAKAKLLQRFFKTGPGEYAEGDIFYGVMVPQTRAVAKKYASLPLADCERLLQSAIHEERLAALLLLINQFKLGDEQRQKKIFALYLRNTKCINNWDLVDLSAPQIVGGFLLHRDKAILTKLAKSPLLWKRRIAIIATLYFIVEGKETETLRIARILLHDEHDLIHKAVGWMLREVGKRCSKQALTGFLDRYAEEMPRTMLRYAIERLPEKERQRYMKR